MGRSGVDSRDGKAEAQPGAVTAVTDGGGRAVGDGACSEACAVGCGCLGVGTQCAVSLAVNGDQSGTGSVQSVAEGSEREIPSDDELRKNFRVHLNKAEADGDIAVLTRLITANLNDANRYQAVVHALFGVGTADKDANPEAFSAISASLLQEHSPSRDGWFLDRYSVEPINLYDGEGDQTDEYKKHESYVYRLAELKRYLVGFIMGHMAPFKNDPMVAFFILSTIKPSPAMQTSVVEELQSGGTVVRDAFEVLKRTKAYHYLALLTVQAETVTIKKSCAAYIDMYFSEITDVETLQVLAQCKFPVAEAARVKLAEIEGRGADGGEVGKKKK